MPRPLNHNFDSRNKMSTVINRMLPMAIGSKIHCLSIGKVVKYNHSDHTCNVQPLAKFSNGEKRPIYNYCIVPASIWQHDLIIKQLDNYLSQLHRERNYSVIGGKGGYVKGDSLPKWKSVTEAPIKWKPLQYGSIVAVGACDREIDNLDLKTKRPYQIETGRMHSFNDGIILGVIKP